MGDNMAELKRAIMGPFFTPVGFDGFNFYSLMVDSLGHLSVDVVTSALPLNAATQTTLADVLTCIGTISAPAAGSINNTLWLMLNAIGDLSGPPPGSINTQLADIVARLGALSTPAAGSVNAQLADLHAHLNTYLDQTGTTLKASIDAIQTALVSNNLELWHDTYGEIMTGSGNSGQIAIYGTAVPAGHLLVITNMFATVTAGSSTDVNLCGMIDGANVVQYRLATPALNAPVLWSGRMVLDVGDKVRCNANGVGAGTTVSFHATGYFCRVS